MQPGDEEAVAVEVPRLQRRQPVLEHDLHEVPVPSVDDGRAERGLPPPLGPAGDDREDAGHVEVVGELQRRGRAGEGDAVHGAPSPPADRLLSSRVRVLYSK